MRKKKLAVFETAYCTKIEKELRKIALGFAPETIHQFRLRVKKLKAFYRMLTGGENVALRLKIDKPLRYCYRIAGSIRDLQLQQQRVKEASASQTIKPVTYLHLLQYNIDQLKSRLSRMIALHPCVKNKLNKSRKHFQKFTLIQFNAYAASKHTMIKAIIEAGIFTDADLHTIRKALKELAYNAILFKRNSNGKVPDKLLTELGNFQDKVMALSLLKNMRRKKTTVSEQSNLGQIRNRWMHEKATLKKSLIEKLERYFLT